MDSGKYQCNMTVLEGEQQGNITHEILISGECLVPIMIMIFTMIVMILL